MKLLDEAMLGSAGQTAAVTYGQERFMVAASIEPRHHLNMRDGQGLFPELRAEFYATRQPLTWGVALALFYFTDESNPGEWQSAEIDELTDLLYELDFRRDSHKTDALTELWKLWDQTAAIVAFDNHGKISIRGERILNSLELVYQDRQAGARVLPSNQNMKTIRQELEFKGRRKYEPGKGGRIWSLPPERFRLVGIKWRWGQQVQDDLMPPKDKRGGWIRKRSFRQVSRRIFPALAELRRKKAYTAHDLLLLGALDIRNIKKGHGHHLTIEREATRLWNLLGLDATKPWVCREQVARAVRQLKALKVLQACSDEHPREKKCTTGKARDRVNPSYRLTLFPDYAPPGIISADEADEIEQGAIPPPEQAAADPLPEAKRTPPPPDNLPGMEPDTFPSGAEILAAMKAAGWTYRRLEAELGGPSSKTWCLYLNGKAKPPRLTVEVRAKALAFCRAYGGRE